jgi:pimeloyl-ACP methyl ester carboxylesterase
MRNVPAAVWVQDALSRHSTPHVRRELKVTGMMLDEPHIEVKALAAITAPTLVVAGDHDLIRDEHTIAVYQHIR